MSKIKEIDWLLTKAYEKLYSTEQGRARQDRSPSVNDAVSAVEFLRNQRWEAVCRSRQHKGRGKAKR